MPQIANFAEVHPPDCTRLTVLAPLLVLASSCRWRAGLMLFDICCPSVADVFHANTVEFGDGGRWSTKKDEGLPRSP